MNADRKMIELAAKAAGIKFKKNSSWGGGALTTEDDLFFDPLHNSGDAFKLAIKLELKVMVLHDVSQPKPWLRIEDQAGRWTHVGTKEFEKNPYGETRRAIVIAASKLAKATKEQT